ncbi:hypothetical protein Cflav_PD2773 [Pedosphaera parvula Ellin514]|uniref:Uncharacterized protein n=1 Tax=Pedosphaera parvula (strain Ellin514) TaxID=320771 RepID=B9XJU3_PEDPL|nr:hypothetical protein Cflav_PD2773 [Pedosphaera parvula Ellin514]
MKAFHISGRVSMEMLLPVLNGSEPLQVLHPTRDTQGLTIKNNFSIRFSFSGNGAPLLNCSGQTRKSTGLPNH